MPRLQLNQNLKEWSVQPLLKYIWIVTSLLIQKQWPPDVRETQHCESSPEYVVHPLFAPANPPCPLKKIGYYHKKKQEGCWAWEKVKKNCCAWYNFVQGLKIIHWA